MDMFNRPKLKLKITPLEFISKHPHNDFICFGSLVYLFINWSVLPEKVPAYYNALGEVDRWGSKGEILILPIIGAAKNSNYEID